MTTLRKAINRYVAWLEARAQRHRLFSAVLSAVAHRLQHILENTDDQRTEIQFAVRENGDYRILDAIDDVPAGTTIYTRTITYTPWKEI